jgi:hypothetical protein
MSYQSTNFIKLGDVDVGRSQLGKSWSGILSTPVLWNNEFAANRYCFTINANSQIFMPPVGLSVNEAQPGYWVTNADPYTLSIFETSGLTELAILYPLCSATFIANLSSPTGWTVTYNTSDFVRAQLRAGVDPTSNPDPLIGGLLIPAGSVEFNMPLTILPQSLGLADPFISDNSGFFSVDSDGINLMYENDYQASFNVYIIGFGASQNQLQIGQILQDGQTIFNAPPICAASDYAGAIVSMPAAGVIWLLTGTANFKATTAPVKLVLRLMMNSATDLIISLTSNFSIEKI